MSLEDFTVSFKLQSGEIFDGIRLENAEWTLAKFVDENLKRLEVSRQRKVLKILKRKIDNTKLGMG